MASSQTPVVKFYPKGAASNPDNVLEQAMDNYESVIVIGWNNKHELDLRASTNLTHAEVNWLLGMVQHKLLSGDYFDG